MLSNTAQGKASSDATSSRSIWMRRFLIALTVLACIAIGAVALYAISLISEAVIILIVSALLAYLIYPLVRFLQRGLSRPLAVIIAYLGVASIIGVSLSLVVVPLLQQSSSLLHSISFLLSPEGVHHFQLLLAPLAKLGISHEQIVQLENQVATQVQGAVAALPPFLLGTINNLTTLVIVVTFSVYFVLDGSRIISWLCLKTPAAHRGTITFMMHVLDRSIGGYFRGLLLLAVIGSLSTGIGLTLLHVPYAALLGVLFFLLFFIPMIGGFVIGVLCILAALSQGWVTALIVAIFMGFLQGIVLGQILPPRVFRSSVGIHPIVALFALLAGGQLFGVLGGFLSVPVAGVLQEIIVAVWQRWKAEHPNQFPSEEPSLPQPAHVAEK
jgi:predicted PurR-regulated permease PerM